MKIAILYICTGKYDIFWQDFYLSAKRNFCLSEEKHFFVFTDSKNIEPQDDINIIYQDNLGWPFNTLYRYKMFLRIQNELLKFDKVVFLNANCVFNVKISFEEFFGIDKDYIACLHPGFFNAEVNDFTYEKRNTSMAYVSNQKMYVAGGINGGSAGIFIEYCKILSTNVEKDLQNGIVAIWHDESHWNAFINNNYEQLKDKLQILDPSYLYPDGWKLPFDKKIILRDKNKYGGHNSMRGLNNVNTSFRNILKKLLKKILCR